MYKLYSQTFIYCAPLFTVKFDILSIGTVNGVLNFIIAGERWRKMFEFLQLSWQQSGVNERLNLQTFISSQLQILKVWSSVKTKLVFQN